MLSLNPSGRCRLLIPNSTAGAMRFLTILLSFVGDSKINTSPNDSSTSSRKACSASRTSLLLFLTTNITRSWSFIALERFRSSNPGYSFALSKTHLENSTSNSVRSPRSSCSWQLEQSMSDSMSNTQTGNFISRSSPRDAPALAGLQARSTTDYFRFTWRVLCQLSKR